MPHTSTDTISQIAAAILAYLAEHPKAQDTLEGIVEWWLLEQEIKRRTAMVQEALAELLTKGLVVERKGRDGRMHYRLNRHKRQEIAALLKQWSQ
jgi:predicted transcriptional regulator